MFRWLHSGQTPRPTFSKRPVSLAGVVVGSLVVSALLLMSGCDKGSDDPVSRSSPSPSEAAPSSTAPAASRTPTSVTRPTPDATAATTTSNGSTDPPTPVVEEVDMLLSTMTLEDKVGQLFVVEVFGKSADDEDGRNRDAFGVDTPAEIIEDFDVGGVLYFAENVSNPLQVATLSNDLQAAAAAGSGIGLLIAADQEGGRVVRIGEPATVFPSALTFGEVDSTDLTRRAAEATAAELRAMGINQVYAPVADVVAEPESQIIGDRSYGSDPAQVADHTAAAAQGFGAGSVAATAKHWPGHGNTATDSHAELAVIDIDRETWESVDRPPFEAAIDAGIPAVMVGHIEIQDVGGPGPATLSRAMIETELREVLGFDGIVVTDALRMDGVRNSASDAAIAVQALQAGADMLLLPFDFHVAREAVIEAVEAGAISEARLDESVARILSLKRALGVLAPPLVDLDAVGSVVGQPAHTEINEAVQAQVP